MDIIKISNIINEFGYRVSTVIGRSFGNSTYFNYGDYGRTPYPYLETNTTQRFFVGSLPPNLNNSSYTSYQNFPKLSQYLLRELFASIGVEYVPEIALYQLNTQTPFKVFEKFCTAFSRHSTRIDASEINDVILKLKDMDSFREVYPLNSKPIYFQLSLLEFDKASELITQMQEIVGELVLSEDNRTEEMVKAKENLIRDWDSSVVVEAFRKNKKLENKNGKKNV